MAKARWNMSAASLNAASDKDFVVTGQQVQIHVDPNDISRWTDRTEAEPMSRRLIAGAVIFPVVLATGVTALLLRRRVLRIWREGEAEVFSVVDTHHSALAPLSHTVRAVAVAGHDRRLVTVCLPGKLPRPQKGEALWLIHPRGKPMSSIAAAAFEGGAPRSAGLDAALPEGPRRAPVRRRLFSEPDSPTVLDS